MRFLGLDLAERVPDVKTVWLFREQLVQAGAMEDLFRRFDGSLCEAGYLAMGGQIVDATVVAAPKQRNTDSQKASLKRGEVPQAWRDKPAKLRQKDRDARWTVKFSKAKLDPDGKAKQRDIAVPAFGYKNHAAIDRRHGFIRGWSVTSAAAYDGAQLCNVLDRGNTGSKVWADSAYRSKKNEAWLGQRGYVSDIHHKKPKGRPMSEATSRANGRRSKIRAVVEHVFAHPYMGHGHGFPRRRMPRANGERTRKLHHDQAHGQQSDLQSPRKGLAATPADDRSLGRRLPRKSHQGLNSFTRSTWLGPHLIGRLVPVALPQPGGVVEGGEFGQCESQLLDGGEVPDPEQLFLQRADDPLGDAVALGLAHEGGRAGDPHEADLVLEILRHIV
jgi:IS5 family transposase